jgi:hypothetical protein
MKMTSVRTFLIVFSSGKKKKKKKKKKKHSSTDKKMKGKEREGELCDVITYLFPNLVVQDNALSLSSSVV